VRGRPALLAKWSLRWSGPELKPRKSAAKSGFAVANAAGGARGNYRDQRQVGKFEHLMSFCPFHGSICPHVGVIVTYVDPSGTPNANC